MSPLQGLRHLGVLHYPGRCPGLSDFALSGPKAEIDEHLTDEGEDETEMDGHGR